MNMDINHYTWYKITFAIARNRDYYTHNYIEYAIGDTIASAVEESIRNINRKLRNEDTEEITIASVISVKQA